MLPWIIGGVVVLVGAALSASEEEARKESEKKLQTKHQKYEKQYNMYAQECREEQLWELLKILRQELKVLQKEQEKVMQMLSRSPNGSKVFRALEIKHQELLINVEKTKASYRRSKTYAIKFFWLKNSLKRRNMSSNHYMIIHLNKRRN